MEFSRFVTQRASVLGAIFVVAITFYGATIEDPPRHPETTQTEGR